MNTRIAKTEECEKVKLFYDSLIDAMQEAEYKPGWEKNVYPTQEFLLNSIKAGACKTDGSKGYGNGERKSYQGNPFRCFGGKYSGRKNLYENGIYLSGYRQDVLRGYRLDKL